MNTLRCIVVDDEPLARNLIISYIEKTPFLELIAGCGSAAEATTCINESHPDVVFLDIQMPGMTGMELARFIKPETLIIFITAYDHYAIEGFKVNAIDYLLKPVSYNDFLSSAQRAMNVFEQRHSTAKPVNDEQTHIIVRSDYKLVQLPVKDILFIEGVKDYVKIYTSTDNGNKPVITLMNMKSLEQKLPAFFMRVHRSYIVNTNNITAIERGSRIVFGEHYIPVGETYRAAFNAYLASRTIN
jgi:DNA-binding LytR/AlgR family response regulator